MKRIHTSILTVMALLAISAFAVKVGDSAPDFTGTDSHGQAHKLSDYRGKFVVLEWHNNGCPFTKKHYESGNMQRLQKQWTDKGVVWLTVISSSPGSQGYVTADQENDYMQRMHAAPTAALLDPKGEIGHLYGAKTTPHMFVINPQGQIIYNGAIDDKPTPDPSDVNGAKNYVSEALQESMAGQAVAVATTRPYGCSVKYAD
ncbi:MAG TPA: thioredoxin family protein [Terriglobales bacterium]|nr:thioredoxin family protein [Terriglobales bacterium]